MVNKLSCENCKLEVQPLNSGWCFSCIRGLILAQKARERNVNLFTHGWNDFLDNICKDYTIEELNLTCTNIAAWLQKAKDNEATFFTFTGFKPTTGQVSSAQANLTNYSQRNKTNDPVNPDYYKKAGLSSPIHLIRRYDLNFAVGNVIKYAARYKEKNGREDLKKALFYILWELGVDLERIEEITKEVK